MDTIDNITIRDNDGEKRLKAEIKYKNGKTITVNFGMKNSKGTFADGATDDKREAYLKRHRVRENWRDIRTAGYWSRWILWERRENADIKKLLKEKTGAKNITVNFKRYKVAM